MKTRIKHTWAKFDMQSRSGACSFQFSHQFRAAMRAWRWLYFWKEVNTRRPAERHINSYEMTASDIFYCIIHILLFRLYEASTNENTHKKNRRILECGKDACARWNLLSSWSCFACALMMIDWLAWREHRKMPRIVNECVEFSIN